MDSIQQCNVNKIAVFYGHVASNLGDLAINAGELIALKRIYPNAEVTFVALHVSEGPAYDNAQAETARVGESIWTIYRTSFHHALNYLSQPAQFLASICLPMRRTSISAHCIGGPCQPLLQKLRASAVCYCHRRSDLLKRMSQRNGWQPCSK